MGKLTNKHDRHGDRRDENAPYTEGQRMKVCRTCRGSGSTRHSPQCPKCHGVGMR